MKSLIRMISALTLLFSVAAFAQTTKVKFHGHACFEITTPRGHVLVIDPWLRNPLNPAAKNNRDPVQDFKRVDYILVTHGHFDHVGDATALAKKTKARLVAVFELASTMSRLLSFPADQMGFDTLGNTGGELPLANGEVTVAFVPAVHSSGVDTPDADAKHKAPAYGGNPVGFVIKIQNGPTIYHTGDTAYFSDMALIGDTYAPDLALINIGGHFGMSPEMAAKAAQAVKAKLVVPQHYKSFPVLTQDAAPFLSMLDKAGIKSREMAPGAEIEFNGTRLK